MAGIRILRLRHRTAPEVNGCRWCGILEIDHRGHVYTPRHHQFTDPTDAQRKARFKARAAPKTWSLWMQPEFLANKDRITR